MEIVLLTGLLLGLTSNLHCIGMCGPIAMAIPLNRTNNLTVLGGALQYNVGRIFTYSILGVIVGSFGLTINTIGILQWLSIAAGIGIIIFAWRKFFRGRLLDRFSLPGIQSFLSRRLGKIMKSKSPLKLLALGGLNGLLPCGMVFAGLLNAVLAGNPLNSALAMAAFGVGTLPSMLMVAFAANKIGQNTRAKVNKVVPYLLTVVGLLIVLRGMNLDIPYISPKVNAVETEVTSETSEPAVEMSCCHSSTTCE